ncbi:MAG: sigma-70 family RNA polymerase sigma factor [Verrucomicrobia bacterium]|nr:sigma-70 family RNA polymerase sigma factor [Verrucomicrobiota bacterium]
MDEPIRPVNGEGLSASALRAELEKHHRASYGWSLGCCRSNRTEAEDVLQSVYLKVLSGKARYDGRAAFRTWLFAVIRRTAIDAHRRAVFRRWWLTDFRPDDDGGPAGAGREAPVDEPAFRTLFRRELDALAARQREALHLVFYQEMSVQQAAEVMGVSLGSARTHYERGKRRLRERLTASPLYHETGFPRPNAHVAL